MAVLLKVKNSQSFVDKLNKMLDNNRFGDKPDTWIIAKFNNSYYYTHYSFNGVWNNVAWFRVCPDDIKKSFNDSRKTSYNLIFRLHGTINYEMTRELFCFYHSRFVEFLLNNMIDDTKEIAITTLKKDIEELDRFKNYDWR